MYKRELLKMDKLLATPHMLRIAAEDKPKIESYYGYYTRETYKYGLYMRCRVQNGILKVAFYSATHMRMGGKKPVFDLYIDKKNDKYLTYDHNFDKWRTATIHHLICYSYKAPFPSGGQWISREGKKVLRKYFETEQGDFDTIIRYQNSVIEANKQARYKRETDPWDEDLEQTPKLPKDWERWTRKVAIPEYYMFYNYTNRKHKTGYCTYCEKEVDIENPRHNADGICPRCHREVTYKAIGRFGTFLSKYHNFYLMQRCTDGMMIREFYGCVKYRKGDYEHPIYLITEDYRIICDNDGHILRSYVKGVYKDKSVRWLRRGNDFDSYWRNYSGAVYGKTLPSLSRTILKKTGLPEYLKKFGKADPSKYLSVRDRSPVIEKFIKADLNRLAQEFIYSHNVRYEINKLEHNGELTKILGINGVELKRLRESDGDLQFLLWLQFEKATGKLISDEDISWFCERKIQPKELKFIWNKMGPTSIRHYIERQSRLSNEPVHTVITTWSDYLSMARRLKMDTDLEKVYRVKNLRQKHNELVDICNEKAMAVRAGEILEMYPNIENVLEEIKSKYEFADKDYMVVAPTTIEDILIEGRRLDHCVSNDKYMERISTNESYVLFLRKTDKPDVAYYTLEVEPGGTIRQKRTMGDVQNDDIEDASVFLRKWQNEIAARMSGKDRKLAKKSKVLRLEEFAQMDRDNVLIRTGHLQGHRLVDVLMADLMEVAA